MRVRFALVLLACLGGCSSSTSSSRGAPSAAAKDDGARGRTGAEASATLAGKVVSCRSGGVCAETSFGPSARSRCEREGGRFVDGPCPGVDRLSTCTVRQPSAVVLHSYGAGPNADPEYLRGILEGARSSCDAHGGAFRLEVTSLSVSCRRAGQEGLCSEATIFPASAAAVRTMEQDCKKDGGDARVGACPTVDVVGRCALTARDGSPAMFPSVTAYRLADGPATAARVQALRELCERAKGDLQLSSP